MEKKEKNTYILKGIAACSLCGNTLTSHTNRGKRYYRCLSYASKRECVASTVNAKDLEDDIKGQIKSKIGDLYFVEPCFSDFTEENKTFLTGLFQQISMEVKSFFNSDAFKQELLKIQKKVEDSIKSLDKKQTFVNHMEPIRDFLDKAPDNELRIFYINDFTFQVNLLTKDFLITPKNKNLYREATKKEEQIEVNNFGPDDIEWEDV